MTKKRQFEKIIPTTTTTTSKTKSNNKSKYNNVVDNNNNNNDTYTNDDDNSNNVTSTNTMQVQKSGKGKKNLTFTLTKNDDTNILSSHSSKNDIDNKHNTNRKKKKNYNTVIHKIDKCTMATTSSMTNTNTTKSTTTTKKRKTNINNNNTNTNSIRTIESINLVSTTSTSTSTSSLSSSSSSSSSSSCLVQINQLYDYKQNKQYFISNQPIIDINCFTSNQSQNDTTNTNTTTNNANNHHPIELLQKLLYPLNVITFLNQCLQQKAVYIPDLQALQQRTRSTDGSNSTPNNGSSKKKTQQQQQQQQTHTHRLSNIGTEFLFDLDKLSIYQNTASDNIFVWIQQQQQQQQQQKDNGSSNIHNNNNNNNNRHCSATTNCSSMINSIEISDPNSAYILSQAGHATYCRAPIEIETKIVPLLLQATGIGCGLYDTTNIDNDINEKNKSTKLVPLGRGEIEIFIGGSTTTNNNNNMNNDDANTSTSTGTHSKTNTGTITNWHTDFQENITFQLSGIKRWSFCSGTVQYPIRGCTPHYTKDDTVTESQLLAARLSNPQYQFGYPDTTQNTQNNNNNNSIGTIESVIVYPGDVLYFPAGMWHQVEVLQPGISMNISLMGTTYASIVCNSIQHLLLQRPLWRQCIIDTTNRSSNENDKEQDTTAGTSTNSNNNKSSNSIRTKKESASVSATSSTSSNGTVTAGTRINNNNNNNSAINHLKMLLKELPSIIQEFEMYGGGAESILPPILRLQQQSQHDEHEQQQQQQQQSTDTDDDEKELEDDEDADSDLDQYEEVDMDDDSDDDNQNEEDGDDDDDDDDDVESVIDVSQYTVPSSLTINASSDIDNINSRIIINPLAVLLSEKEITSFYSNQSTTMGSSNNANNINNNNNEDNDNHDNNINIDRVTTFILNVNYAGNEMMESMIRVKFKVNKRLMEYVLNEKVMSPTTTSITGSTTDNKKNNNNSTKRIPPPTNVHNDDECDKLISFLIHFGYLVRI